MAFNLRPAIRIISGDKMIDSKFLNLLGAQSLRTFAAQLVYDLRPVSADDAVKNEVDELRREGIVILPSFLPHDHFERLREECLLLFEQRRDIVADYTSGPNISELVVIDRVDENMLPSTYKFLADPRLREILKAAEKRSLGGLSRNAVIQRTAQGTVSEPADPESELHSDTFCNVHKAWLYLNDVAMENGPLVYVKRSHRLNLQRLRYIYAESCDRNSGSRRISRDEQEQLHVQETIVTCPKNTLVIANTFGYHRRLQRQFEQARYAVHISLRANPFAWWR